MREEKLTIGAIRWDAWYKEIEGNTASAQVQRSLSPAEFHFRAPFFARVTDENKITIDEYGQEQFDREAEYAIDAGIDYFAYVWYRQEGLRAARDLHLTSKYKNDIKLCACLDGNALNMEFAHNELLTLFKDKAYKTVLGGRPLIYYFGSGENDNSIKADIEFYKAECEKLGIPTPYNAIMGFDPMRAKAAGADASTAYCIGGRDGLPYKALAQKAYVHWSEICAAYNSGGSESIITIAGGWNNQPRYKNPVNWIHGDLSRSWAQVATADELEAHFKQAIEFMKDEANFAATPTNTAIVYAWNEHDEGGWICPTIAVDENGKQLYNADGTPKINDERIKAVKRAIKG